MNKNLYLSIIIVSYNTAEITLAAVKSVVGEIKNSATLNNESEIILVDNDSKDNSVKLVSDYLQKNFDKFVVIRNDSNLGFAQANNKGISQSKGKFILLLNSDTIIKPKALEKLLETFENNPIKELTANLESAGDKIDRLGIVAANLLNPDGSRQPQGGSFPTLLSVAMQMLMLDDLPLIGKLLPSTQHTGKNTRTNSKNKLIVQDWVGGTAMLIKKQVVDEIGDLDGNIFMYAEDVEFCLRAKNHHWDIVINPKSEIIHLGSASSTSANAIIGELKGYVYIWKKHKPDWQLPILLTLLKLGTIIRMFVFGTILGNKQKFNIYKKAFHEI